jgi:hypothetical protein
VKSPHRDNVWSDAMFRKNRGGICSECRSGTDSPVGPAGDSFFAGRTESGYRQAVPTSHFFFFPSRTLSEVPRPVGGLCKRFLKLKPPLILWVVRFPGGYRSRLTGSLAQTPDVEPNHPKRRA